MTKVTLLGDSIRQIGYGTKVPALLGEDYTIFQPEDNCRFAKYTLRGVLHEWKEKMAGSDIIHWNNGLWDVCDLGDGAFSSEEEYVSTMVRIAKLLTQQAKVVIFATTTPVTSDNADLKNERIKHYNDILVPILQDMGILINDLFSLVSSDIDSFIRKDDKIHLTDAGIDACAKQVVDAIKEAEKLI
ncbi:MAG: SGNH/GDSL hydrolase family protein [Clostridia bacterium]|nr:SGNH/GDSL hydrolase family protein [Clostridia bacterium]